MTRGVTIRVLRPMAKESSSSRPTSRIPMAHEHRGVWVAVLAAPVVPDYTVDVDYGAGI